MNLSSVGCKIGIAEKDEIVKHLKKCDQFFNPALSSYNNIDLYSKKIKDFAVTFEAWYKKELVGLVAVYLNKNK